ncbi:hypothetical protein EYF80_041225 [Liparis tanakae]|uniref:Uncharacterized protein n=1 Tax=Liparis tanakae TaxID=230148 RepID=A0A4Z2G6N7_9TELE|nr:hypothetical protein EYF80_041225 [Liparis tanakae]
MQRCLDSLAAVGLFLLNRSLLFIDFKLSGRERNVVDKVRYLGHIVGNDLSDDDVQRPCWKLPAQANKVFRFSSPSKLAAGCFCVGTLQVSIYPVVFRGSPLNPAENTLQTLRYRLCVISTSTLWTA